MEGWRPLIGSQCEVANPQVQFWSNPSRTCRWGSLLERNFSLLVALDFPELSRPSSREPKAFDAKSVREPDFASAQAPEFYYFFPASGHLAIWHLVWWRALMEGMRDNQSVSNSTSPAGASHRCPLPGTPRERSSSWPAAKPLTPCRHGAA